MVSEQLPHIVILAGGGGTRLWPASRRARPKFLMTVRGHQTMLDETISRATMFTDPDRILLVTGARNATEVGVIAERWGVAMIAEPSPRDTAASLVLAALLIQQNDPGAVVISMPADHLIDGSTQFMASMRDCITEAQRDRIACIGVSPQGPNTNFGYVKAPSDESTSPRAATSFHEKPDAAAALRYWRSGAYFWNTAIMGWRSNILLSVAETVAADLAAMVAQAVQTDGTIDGEKWTKLPKIAAEPALIEPAASRGSVVLVPAAFSWVDVGTWSAVADLSAETPNSLVLSHGSRQPFVYTSTVDSVRRYAVVGLDDVIIVDCGDVVLVTTRAHASGVKGLVDGLHNSDCENLL